MHAFPKCLSRSEYCYLLDGTSEKCENLSNLEKIRTFCVRYLSQEEQPPNLLIGLLKHVRLLCLSGCDLQQLPQEIGKLIHLRYVDLSLNPVRELPETATDLYNWRKLDLESCHIFSRLPHGVEKLINLRHLLVSGTSLTEFPQGLQKLTRLWTLDKFTARSLIIELQDLDEVEDVEIAKKANLRNKNHIQSLKLIISTNIRMDVVEAMVPPPDLQTINIKIIQSRYIK
ncbi:Ras suppressor protein (contains leucine-rich repeats) [Handroanthus impetiginosus]|uniref:Ras suppressor protein (Contains leucine-rich repeats) n=1 Tax=Handroanthus impetiginosus TaxID=429701 RepID=A0A2G9HHS1_9LAMI|nr:Ras suppressor protein (contains leucine-rich repeats) [Handroanthus impetiginosus]